MIREELHRVHPKGILVEVEHVKAHRSKKGMQQMSFVEKFISEGNEKADEQAKEGARLDGGDMAQMRAATIQQEKGRGSCSFTVCSQLSLSGGGMERLRRAQAKAKRKEGTC